ncbi:transposase, partial [Actinoplanes sp. DH11]|uniref:transposase n=1 Tax=Actinoplanes sp. DH11 TaxID=2857011 RepID=UPI001E4B41FD
LVSSHTTFGITLITPVLADTRTQATTPGGYDRTAFTIDYDQQQATCPQGHTTSTWIPGRRGDTDIISIAFTTTVCRPCPAKTRCTTASRRYLTIRPQPIQQA